jgi:hypothetical protein
MEPLTILAIGSTLYALFSEVVGLNSKWKSNSVVQVLLTIGKTIFKK